MSATIGSRLKIWLGPKKMLNLFGVENKKFLKHNKISAVPASILKYTEIYDVQIPKNT